VSSIFYPPACDSAAKDLPTGIIEFRNNGGILAAEPTVIKLRLDKYDFIRHGSSSCQGFSYGEKINCTRSTPTRHKKRRGDLLVALAIPHYFLKYRHGSKMLDRGNHQMTVNSSIRFWSEFLFADSTLIPVCSAIF
jgi:hypothetical protein